MQSYHEPPGLLPGQFRFQSVYELGTGGLGVVDAVTVIETNQSYPLGAQLARKRLNSSWARDPGAQARFEREIQMLARMDHPNIVPLRGVSVPGGQRAYFMPLYPGSLRSELQSGAGWPIARAAKLGIAVARALSYAHSLGFTHRDLKPDNILINGSGAALSDWGLGQFIHKHSKVLNLTVGGPLGTEYYCCLEQWSSGNGGIAGDVYSLGMTLAELTAGTPPAIRAIGLGIENDVLIPSSLSARRFNLAIRKMTSFLAGNRHQDMNSVVSDLIEVLAVH